MISLSLKTIAQEIDGELVGDGSITVSGVETDSRKNVEGILFVALKGERFDAHEFIKDVYGPDLPHTEFTLTLAHIADSFIPSMQWL